MTAPETQDFRSFRLGAQEAASALADLAREARRSGDADLAQLFLALGRRFGAEGTVESLIATTRAGDTEFPGLALALQFRAADVVAPVLQHLIEAECLRARRVHFALLIALGGCCDLREALARLLTSRLSDPRWYVVRNAVVLLSAIGVGVPRRRWHGLAVSAHRQVRLALAQEVSRWTPDTKALDVLLPLLEDPDEGVRFTAAVALGAYRNARVTQALLQRLQGEHDTEVAAACRAALRRKTPAHGLMIPGESHAPPSPGEVQLTETV